MFGRIYVFIIIWLIDMILYNGWLLGLEVGLLIKLKGPVVENTKVAKIPTAAMLQPTYTVLKAFKS